MSKYYVTLTFKCIWQFKQFPHIKVTNRYMVINDRTGNLLRHTERGYYIEGRYYSKSDVRNSVEKIKESETPF